MAAELKTYNVDIAALSETQLPDEGSLVQLSKEYIFFKKGLAFEDRCIHRVGFTIRNVIVKELIETSTGHTERLISIRIPLSKNKNLTFMSVYGPYFVRRSGSQRQIL